MKQVIAKLLKEAIENKGVKITKAKIEKLIVPNFFKWA